MKFKLPSALATAEAEDELGDSIRSPIALAVPGSVTEATWEDEDLREEEDEEGGI